jgi:hypothetical protein
MLNELQRLALKRFDEYWVVDMNFRDEPIVYVHSPGNASIEEFVIDKGGLSTHTATYPYTIKLQKELKKFERV